MKITLQDARESGYGCAWGAWRIAKRHGFDAEALRRFANEGIEEEILLALGDAQVAKVVDYVHQREGRGKKSFAPTLGKKSFALTDRNGKI